MFTLRAAIIANLAIFTAPLAHAAHKPSPIVIQVSGGIFDMAYDSTHTILYMTTGKSDILRYNLTTRAFLPSLPVLGALLGVDISADGSTLAVADAETGDGKVWIYVVDLASGKARRVFGPAIDGAAGTFDPAFSGSNTVVVSGALPPGYSGAGVPMYVADLTHNKLSQVTGTNQAYVTEQTVVRPSSDHTVVSYTAGDISNGPWGTVNAAKATFALFGTTNWFTYDVAAAPKGKYFAVPTYDGTFVYNHAGLGLETLGTYAQTYFDSVAFDTLHPWKLYQSLANSSQIQVYDVRSAKLIGAYDTGVSIPWDGNGSFGIGTLRIASDNSLLFMNSGAGVVAVPLK